MATADKNVLITPNKSSSSDDPKIVFTGADSTTSATITMKAYPTNGGTLSIEGSAGQLINVINTLTGTLFSVNDISGLPSLEVYDTGRVNLNYGFTPRVYSISYTSPIIWNSDKYDTIVLTAVTGNSTINADIGSPIEGQRVLFRLKTTGTGLITWTAGPGTAKGFRAVGINLPTTYLSGYTYYVGCVFNSIDNCWDAIAVKSGPY